MAYRQQTMDFGRSEQILKAGHLKYRELRMLTRWKTRYVEFKITAAGRLSFTVYREQPATPSNEVTQVSIEEYGGLDHTMKLDGEKHVFAIITTDVTECFAADSAATLEEWVDVIHEYLGKELVFAINVPIKQNVLKAGKGFIRIRNTAFTITTSDCPPRCMCSWQILHVRKFGGSDNFRFETGSKCPTGEYMYMLNTENNEKVRRVFNDLSHHKPIFTDDRMGRRMTQEHSFLQKIRSEAAEGSAIVQKAKVGGRHSLQQVHERPRMYENTGRSVHGHRPSLPDTCNRPRSHALHLEEDGHQSTTTGVITHSSSSNNIVYDRYYYNMPDSMAPGAAITGATRQLPPLPLPQPENHHTSERPPSTISPYDYHSYYNLTTAGTIPPLSGPPDSSRLPVSPTGATPETEDSEDDFVDPSNISANMPKPSMYYNIFETRQQLAAHQQLQSDKTEPQNYVNVHIHAETTMSRKRSQHSTSPAVPVNVPISLGAVEDERSHSPHLYTNVNIDMYKSSHKSSSGSPPMAESKPSVTLTINGRDSSSRSPSPRTPPSVHVTKSPQRHSPRTRSKNGPPHSLSSSNSSDSGSDQELSEQVFRKRTTSIVENKLVSADFSSRSCEDLTKLAGPILKTLQESNNGETHSDSEVSLPRSSKVHSFKSRPSKSKLVHQSKSDENRSFQTSSYPPKVPPKSRPSMYDHLDLKLNGKSPVSSPEPELTFSIPSRPNSRTNYDTLEPVGGRIPTSSSDDETEEHQTPPRSADSDYQVFTLPQASTRQTTADTMVMYNRKVKATGRRHTYEEVDLPDDRPLSSGSSTADSPEPSPIHVPIDNLRKLQYSRKVAVTGREHAYELVEPTEYVGGSSKDAVDGKQEEARPADLQIGSKHSRNGHSSSRQRSRQVSPETLSSPMKKPLPIQHTAPGYSDDIGLSTVVEEESLEVRQGKLSPNRPRPLPRVPNGTSTAPFIANHRPPFRHNQSLIENRHKFERKSPTHYSQRNPPAPTTSLPSKMTDSPRRSGPRPTRSSAPAGPPPPLPPRPTAEQSPNHQRSRSDDSSSRDNKETPPMLPPRPFDREVQQLPVENYTRVYVSTNVANGRLTVKNRDEKVKLSPYTTIDHFATEQLGILSEARKMEKQLTALPRQY